ncbi:coilin isoform X1 [Crotalus tigris]|uniref:coilin isoform X1 n=1 Tax=Crotalus tigris TaxID=88082 RepID=UPI00192F320F|nr:coilin isoform X1 [Crotalus tigris]
MAAAMGSGCEAPVRLRLLFDYPPPMTPACGLCWLLVEPNQVRLITDLISLIREKFGFSRHARLNLFLDGALLPPTESARLVRDNDSLRVRLEEIVGLNSYDTVTNGSSSLSKSQRKRQRKLEAKDSESEDEDPNKRKKSKWNFEQKEEKSTNIQDSVTLGKKKKAAPERSHMMDTESEDDNSHSKKLRKKIEQGKEQDAKKNKKKKASTCPSKSTSQKTEKSFSQKSTKGNTTAQSNPKKGSSSSESSTSSSDSNHSTPGTKQTNTHASKGTSQHINKPQLASLKSLSTGKYKDKISLKTGETKKAKNQSSSSDSDSSSEEEQQSSNLKNKLPYQKQETVTGHSSKTEPKSSSSESDDSSESETDALKKQNAIDNLSVRGNDKQLSDVSYGLASNLKENRRGRGRGETPSWRGPRVRGCRGMTRDRGRGERVHFFYNYSSENQKQKQLNEAATNASVIIQNPVEAPKKDYSTLPLLAAPPQVGQKIAFKLLELTENYTPEVSDYKEGNLVSWNPVNKQLELEILSFSSVAKEPGKFDLVYQSEDGDETIEYAVSQDRKITQSWEALIEPRLIIDSPPNESGPPKEIPSNMNLPDPQM